MEAAGSIFYSLCEQEQAAEQAPPCRERPALPTAGAEALLTIAKAEPVEMEEFSPRQQPEGAAFYELDIAPGEQTGSLDLRAESSCVIHPWSV